MCVLLFVMKIGFQQMDGGILEEKCNLLGSAKNRGSVMVADFVHPILGGGWDETPTFIPLLI